MWIFEDLANDDFFFDNHGHNLHRHEQRPIQAIKSSASSDSCSSQPSTSTIHTSTESVPSSSSSSSPCLLFAIDVWKEQLQLTVENQGTGVGSDGKVVDVADLIEIND